jgi:hypothetical protein
MTSMKTWLAMGAVVMIAGSTWAQQPAPTDDPAQADEEQTRPPASEIQFRPNPYDNTSLYGARRGNGYFAIEDPFWYGRNPYYVRNRGGYYARSSRGYGYRPGYTYSRGRNLVGRRYSHQIGQNGELFLFAPTVLATVGPLTGVFYEGER